MVRIPNKTQWIKATKTVVGEDMAIEALVFSATEMTTKATFEYDVATKEGKAAGFRTFAESAEVVDKDGFATVKVKPFQINQKVTFNYLDEKQRDFGATEYDEKVESDLLESAKMHSNALIRRKKMIGSVLAYHNLTLARDGLDAEFNVPTANKEVKTAEKWDSANAPVVADMKNAKDKMKSKPTMAIMNPKTYANMIKNGDLTTADNNSAGVAKNFELNAAVDNGQEVYRAGRVIDPELVLDVYVWNGKDGNDYYLPDGFVAYTNSKAGLSGFAGVYVRPKPNATAIMKRAEFTMNEIKGGDDPIVDAINYKSAPIYILKDNEGFYSQKVY